MLGSTRLVQSLFVLSCACCALLPAGCVSQVERACDLQCDCTGCSEARYVDCVDQARRAEEKASAGGCAGRFTSYLACLEEEIECRDDKFSYDGCDDEELALRECGVTVFRSLCELASDHQTACQVGPFVPAGECAGAVECQAKCVLGASCDAFTGANPMEILRFNDCISRC
jgi:hypothetical protein